MTSLNVSTEEQGITLPQVRSYWPDQDIQVLRGAGVVSTRLFFDISLGASPAVIQDTITRFSVLGPTVINLRYKDGSNEQSMSPAIQWWSDLLRPATSWRLPANAILDPLNEPDQIPVAIWQSTAQPQLVGAIRKLAGPGATILLHSGGYEGIAGYPPFIKGASGIIIPKDGPYKIALHHYEPDVATYSADNDDYNLSHITAWAATVGTTVLVTESGCQQEPVGWNAWVNTMSKKMIAYAKFGLTPYIWMNKFLFESDVPGHRTIRPDVLAALSLATYAPPVMTAGTSTQPPGSLVWPVGATGTL